VRDCRGPLLDVSGRGAVGSSDDGQICPTDQGQIWYSVSPWVPANSNMHVADGCRGAPTAKSEVAPGAGPGDRQGRPQVLYFVLVAHD